MLVFYIVEQYIKFIKIFCFLIILIQLFTAVCNRCRKASSLLFLGVHRSSVRRQGRFDSLPAIRRPNDVRRSSVEEPHRHLDNADVSGTNIQSIWAVHHLWSALTRQKSIHKCVCVCVYRAEAVAVQTVSVMVALDPEVTIWDFDVAILVAQSPAVKTEHVLTAPPGGDWATAVFFAATHQSCWGRSFWPDEVSFQADDAFNDLLLGVLGGPGGTEEASAWPQSGPFSSFLHLLHHFQSKEDQSWLAGERANGI